jgi:hypothetical protein
MTLGNMRENGVRSLAVSCLLCHHRAVVAVDAWPDHVPVPSFGPRMVCTGCGIVGADARRNWSERAGATELDRCAVALMVADHALPPFLGASFSDGFVCSQLRLRIGRRSMC